MSSNMAGVYSPVSGTHWKTTESTLPAQSPVVSSRCRTTSMRSSGCSEPGSGAMHVGYTSAIALPLWSRNETGKPIASSSTRLLPAPVYRPIDSAGPWNTTLPVSSSVTGAVGPHHVFSVSVAPGMPCAVTAISVESGELGAHAASAAASRPVSADPHGAPPPSTGSGQYPACETKQRFVGGSQQRMPPPTTAPQPALHCESVVHAIRQVGPVLSLASCPPSRPVCPASDAGVGLASTRDASCPPSAVIVASRSAVDASPQPAIALATSTPHTTRPRLTTTSVRAQARVREAPG